MLRAILLPNKKPRKPRSIRQSSLRQTIVYQNWAQVEFLGISKLKLKRVKLSFIDQINVARFARLPKNTWPLSGFIFFEHTYRLDAMIPSFLNQLGQVLQPLPRRSARSRRPSSIFHVFYTGYQQEGTTTKNAEPFAQWVSIPNAATAEADIMAFQNHWIIDKP